MKWGHAVRVRKGTILYAAGVLACGNVLLQVLGFVYRVVLSRFAGAEGLGVYRLVNSVYLVLNAGCLSGVTTACSRLSAACEARGESGRLGAVLQLAFRAFFALSAACAAVVLLCGGSIAANLLGDGRCARAFPYMLLCLTLTGVENIFKSLYRPGKGTVHSLLRGRGAAYPHLRSQLSAVRIWQRRLWQNRHAHLRGHGVQRDFQRAFPHAAVPTKYAAYSLYKAG